MNEWNSFVDGLIHGGQKVAQGIMTGNLRKDAYDLYKNANDSLNQYLTGGQQNQNQNKVQPTQSENNLNPVVNNGNQVGVGMNMPMGDIQAPQQSIQPDTQTSKGLFDYLNTMQETNALLGQYGEIGKPYQEALNNQYNTLLGQINKKPDIREVNGQLVERQSDGTYKSVYGNPKPDDRQILSGDENYIQDGEKYFKEYPIWNKTKNEMETKRVPISKELYNEKTLGFEDKLKLRNANRITRGNNGSTKTRPLTQEEKTLGGALKTFGELNKNYANRDEKQVEQYKAIQQQLLPYFNGDYDLMNKYAERIFKATDKEIPKIMNEILDATEEISALDQEEQEFYDAGLQDLEAGEDLTLFYKSFMQNAKSEKVKEYARQKYTEKTTGSKMYYNNR